MSAIIPENVELLFDPGHGGKDPGAVKFGREEDWTLKISLYQFERAAQLGIVAGITRNSDEDLPEDRRVSLVKNSGAKFCFSNHLNAGGGDRAEVVHSIYDDGKFANLIKEELLAVGQNAVKVYCKKGTSGDYYYMHRRTGSVKVNIVEYCFIDNEADYNHFAANWEAYAEAPLKAYCRFTGRPYTPKNTVVSSKPSISYSAHIQDIGWQEVKYDGQTAGTVGQSKRLEALSVTLLNTSSDLLMEAHVESKGWMQPKTNGEVIGTVGLGLRLEALRINSNKHKISYRVHMESIGWSGWVSNGEIAGTIGQSRRIEAVEIKIQ